MIRFKKISAHIEGLDLVVIHDNGATVRIAMSRLESWILRQIRTDFVQPRVEFDRPDDQNQGTKAARRRPVVVLKAEDLEADGISADHARDWLKARKVPLTLTAWAGIKREADKALISYGDVVRLMAEKGWRSFEADWVSKARGSPKPSTQNKYAGASAAIWEDEVTDV